jgi:hypothetical protein
MGDDCMITNNRIKIMNANIQVQQGCVERAGGVPNYKNIKDGPPSLVLSSMMVEMKKRVRRI